MSNQDNDLQDALSNDDSHSASLHQTSQIESTDIDTKTDLSISVKAAEDKASAPVRELGGPKGLEPTRYGDWESKGRCYDF